MKKVIVFILLSVLFLIPYTVPAKEIGNVRIINEDDERVSRIPKIGNGEKGAIPAGTRKIKSKTVKKKQRAVISWQKRPDAFAYRVECRIYRKGRLKKTVVKSVSGEKTKITIRVPKKCKVKTKVTYTKTGILKIVPVQGKVW